MMNYLFAGDGGTPSPAKTDRKDYPKSFVLRPFFKNENAGRD